MKLVGALPCDGVVGLVKIHAYSAIARLLTDNFEMRVRTIEDQRPASFIEFPHAPFLKFEFRIAYHGERQD